jgi:putative ABC transport system permease protein
MNLWHIAWSYLWSRRVSSVITILCVALGVGLISAVLTLREETRKRFEEEGQAFDMVVGGKGSPLQLVLSSVYFLDVPNQNIRYSVYEMLKDHEDVSAAYPIGLGDTYKGFRIVGTSTDLFSHVWVNAATGEETKPFNLKEGRLFEKEMEAVIGNAVAKQQGLSVGDTFVGTHGFMKGFGHSHDDFPYTVVGILEQGGTPFDRAVFCDLHSVWTVHGHAHGAHAGGEDEPHADPHGEDADHDHEAHAHGDNADHDHEAHAHGEDADHDHEAHAHGEDVDHDHGDHSHAAQDDHAHSEGHPDGHLTEEAPAPAEEDDEELEVTAILVQLETPGLRWQFREYINDEINAMAAIPVQEIRKLFDELLGAIKAVLLVVGYLVVVVSALSIMATLYLAIMQRRRDMAIMRALGAAPAEIFGAVVLEAFWITVLGVGGGWLLGNVVSYGFGLYLTQRFGMAVTAFSLSAEEIRAFAAVAIVGLLAGILPAWQAYQTDVARDLAEL